MDNLTIKEQIKLLAARRGLTLGQLADATSQSRQNIALAFRRGDYSTAWLKRIADALNCDLVIQLVPKEDRKP